MSWMVVRQGLKLYGWRKIRGKKLTMVMNATLMFLNAKHLGPVQGFHSLIPNGQKIT
jgi:hypothetical protein